jgi:hypothetical protein
MKRDELITYLDSLLKPEEFDDSSKERPKHLVP